ncbi:E3 ubiquitin-protein ligase ATL76 [Bienertia sinuspersici]
MINDHNKKTKIGGVDKRALKTFPVVKFSKDVKIQGLGTECVICLSEFKGSEKIRILPKCNHGFHVKCIDEWLSSHSSCPTCRQSLVETCQKIIGSAATTAAATTSEEVITVSIVPLEREDLMRNYRGD